MDSGLSFEDAFFAMLKELRGSYAILAIHAAEPDKIMAARRDAPLVIGLGDNHIILDMRHVIQGICPWCGGKISTFTKSRSEIDEDTLLSRVKKKGIKKQNK
jgi:hypothetical protein